MTDAGRPHVSVIMPTFEQDAFLPRAVESLLAQSLTDWELLLIDDGSRDETYAAVRGYLGDPRVHYQKLAENGGLGATLNVGLDHARGTLIAYLPSDDVFYPEHLELLAEALNRAPAANLAIAGVRHHYNRHAEGQIAGEPIQLVQAMHRATAKRWRERAEITTDDLDAMFWEQLPERTGTGSVSCEWVDHPAQRHKAIRTPDGGPNPYRQRYRVAAPLRFRATTGVAVDEVTRFATHRALPLRADSEGLKILLVGELAYNPERVLALAARGHRLYGLWTDTPAWFNAVGPQPFGHVTDLPRNDWQAAIARVRPDVIYALLNWQTVPFAHRVMQAVPDIPFVWHFKEGPFICIEKGSWPELLSLYAKADGRIYSSPEMRDWFALADPRLRGGRPELILDGDLPSADLLRGSRSPRLSARDGEIHTAVPGRPIGLHPETVAELAREGIHLHFYGDFIHGLWREWIDRTRGLAGRFLHIHPTVQQEDWVAELSQYDAGWLHSFASRNGGDLRRADWDDLNLPARMATLALAGLPMIQRDNSGHVVATQTLVRQRGVGLFYTSIADLAVQLRDRDALNAFAERSWSDRQYFTFDHHCDALIALLREAAGTRQPQRGPPKLVSA